MESLVGETRDTPTSSAENVRGGKGREEDAIGC